MTPSGRDSSPGEDQVLLLPSFPSFNVWHLALLLKVVEVDPVVESLNCAVLLLSEEDVFKPAGAENSATPTVNIKPELFEKKG